MNSESTVYREISDTFFTFHLETEEPFGYLRELKDQL